MPKFLSERDVNYFRAINREIIEDVIETMIILYKLDTVDSPTNIYGEAPSKAYLTGVQTFALIRREDKNPTSDGHILDFNQTAVFSFSRDKLEEISIYPEVGDIIEYDSSFWEINNAAENQLLADQPFFNWAVICTCHMTRRSALQLDERQHISDRNLDV